MQKSHKITVSQSSKEAGATANGSEILGRIPNYNLGRKHQAYALFGLLLGDGCYNRGWIDIAHTNKQREYVKWLTRLFSKWNLTYHVRFDYKKKTTYGEYVYSRVKVKLPKLMHRHFMKFGRFYRNGKKVISKYVMRRITPLGLLLWFLDDGTLCVSKENTGEERYKTHRFARLNTQDFDENSVTTARKWLRKRFGIECAIHHDRGLPVLYINATNFRIFYDVVRDYLPSIPLDMTYKFNMKYEPNRLKSSSQYAELYNDPKSGQAARSAGHPVKAG